MNEIEFTKLYNEALMKAAVGVYVIEAAGSNLNLDEYTKTQNIIKLCMPIADQLGLDIRGVVVDAIAAYRRLPTEFIDNPKVEQYIRELECDYESQMELQNKMLETVDI